MTYEVHVNGERREADVEPDTPLLTVLRDVFALTGSRFGCGQGACGACSVLVNGQATAACTMSIEAVAGRAIVTIEGLAHGSELHPVQRAFIEEDAMQCGYCTSGMIIATVALLRRSPHPSDAEIRDALAPHLCRCGVYERVLRAVRRASR